MKNNYKDIINHSHHVSKKRPRMERINRAAQFAPFAALNGYDAEVMETGRLTSRKIYLQQDALDILDIKFESLLQKIEDKPEVTFLYFIADTRKEGGKYVDIKGVVKKIDTVKGIITMEDNTEVIIRDIVDMEIL